MDAIGKWTELCRIRISLFSTLAACTGCLLAAAPRAAHTAMLALCVMPLACGASALNQFLERKTDALMPRTGGRPVPSGRVSPAAALVFSGALVSLGAAGLFFSGGLVPGGLGLFTVLWYAGVYTPLKRKTAFAAVPGALTGAMPAAIGWAYGGGALSAPGYVLPCFFFFMWQVPHFWLFISRHGEEYDRAGLPSLTRLLSERQLSRVIFTWCLCCAASAVLLMFDAAGPAAMYGLPATAALIALCGAAALKGTSGGEKKGKYLFPFFFSFAWRGMNAAALAVMCLLPAGRLL